jgi:hypothetical protein
LRFRPAVVSKIIQQVLNEQLKTVEYDAKTATDTATKIADLIKEQLKGKYDLYLLDKKLI